MIKNKYGNFQICISVPLTNITGTVYWKYNITGAQLRGMGGGLPCPFLKIKKSALILEKNALIVSILRLNLPFKMQF